MRSLKEHSPLPGISVGDIGPKMAFKNLDNGYLLMSNIQIPKENVLSRYSQVVLASFPERNTFMAIKVVNKTRSEPHILMREQRILLKAQDCPFICHLYAAHQSADRVYFITEYLLGGSLGALIKMCGSLDINHVRFYTAEIACGLQFLHQRSIVHRDIKLDNIMLDRSGHIRLIDLGLAQDGVTSSNKISGVTGTLQFMAPEVLLEEDYDTAVDWWSLGIVVSWMAAGQSPFYYGSIRRKVIKAITRKEPKFPPWLDADVKHLLERLLRKKPEERLGVYRNIRGHQFFDTIDWEVLELKRARPPFKPFREVLENRDLLWLEDKTPLHPIDGLSYTSPSWTRMMRRIRL
ncbi:protein kinase C theta type-like [Eleutherodactylus coqui]|uniref:protein kinase C theta type-like n=1 Tax=Eleutherodactylus coqui TaxID=57060 RepID=UPI003462BBDF